MKIFIIGQLLLLPFFIFADQESDCATAKAQLLEAGGEYALAVAKLHRTVSEYQVAWNNRESAQNRLSEADLSEDNSQLVRDFSIANREYTQLHEAQTQEYIKRGEIKKDLEAKAIEYNNACPLEEAEVTNSSIGE